MLTDMRVYADQAATTALGEAAWKAMEPWLKTEFGNPSALYEEGRRARDCVEAAREKTAYLLGAEPREIYLHREVQKRITGRCMQRQDGAHKPEKDI